MTGSEKEEHRIVRQDLIDYIHNELIGPHEETEELLALPHRDYYIAGILYPQSTSVEKSEFSEETLDETGADGVTEKSSDDLATDKSELKIYDLANVYMPSCIGLSCMINVALRADIAFKVTAARYEPFVKEETGIQAPSDEQQAPAKPKKSRVWKRIPMRKDGVVTYGELESGKKKIPICKGLFLLFVFDKTTGFLTASLVNENTFSVNADDDVISQSFIALNSFFQTELEISGSKGQEIFIPRKVFRAVDEKEEQNYELLFSRKQTFAIGHGCAAKWSDDAGNGRVRNVATSSLPVEEVPNIEYQIGEHSEKLKALDMKFLADDSKEKRNLIISELNQIPKLYLEWIVDQEAAVNRMEDGLKEAAVSNLTQCRNSANRILEGIALLESDGKSMLAFSLMNKVMALQQKSDENKWRAFQIAFILMNLPGLTQEKSSDRELVDLIWFPTGGGKTEAYLGTAVFTIIYRRLKYGSDGSGTAVIMRYTLRLLTTQQLQRAARVICACERLRAENERLLGKDKITIGIWVGGEVTPNDVASYRRRLDNDDHTSIVEKCPWCDAKVQYIKKKPRIKCSDSSCPFKDEIPLLFIDEDIYDAPPSLVISTVDKFAAMSTTATEGSKDVARLFAADTGNSKLPPSLIIQDELHLIAGPLGTMVGLFELVIEEMCALKNVTPKIVAATATIRGAKQQCESLFKRAVRQFPPPGIQIGDNFFSKEILHADAPGRIFIGVQASGHTLTTTEIRIMAAILQGTAVLCERYTAEAQGGRKEERFTNPNKYLDPYWTLIAYFNSIRELGKCHSLISQDINDRMKALSQRIGMRRRVVYELLEMTGMRKSKEIPDMLAQLGIQMGEKSCVDTVLTTNMFSVGVDISRLGIMVIASQPKSNAEYIQASSRVGRQYPGIVCALYDFSRSRDKSYYENFTGYHKALYRYVEASSLTPFSKPALDRGLDSVIVSLLRNRFRMQNVKELTDVRSSQEVFDRIGKIILDRVEKTDLRELERTKNILDQRLNDLRNYLSTSANPNYKDFLWSPTNKSHKEMWQWEMLSSMRNVDSSSNITVCALKGTNEVLSQDDSMNMVRSGQLVVPFGIGAIVELEKNKSALIAYWQDQGNSITERPDRRFLRRLGGNEFVAPPTENDKRSVAGILFPKWGYCQKCREFARIAEAQFDFNKKRKQWCHWHDGYPHAIIPIRFIAVCQNGHIDDVPWDVLVHAPTGIIEGDQSHVLKYFSSGPTGGLGNDRIECSCGKKLSFFSLMRADFPCTGRTYLDIRNPFHSTPCSESMEIRHRGASSIYFPIVRSSIYIPDYNDEKIAEAVARLKSVLNEPKPEYRELVEQKLFEQAGVPKETAWKLFVDSFEPVDQDELSDVSRELAYRRAEYLVFSDSLAGRDFFNKNLDLERECEYGKGRLKFPSGVSDIVLVRSLKETRAILGFTRIYPLGTDSSNVESEQTGDVRAHRVSVVRGDRKIPAIEVRGEGIFLRFDTGAIERWAKQKNVMQRTDNIGKRYRSCGKSYGVATDQITPGFVMLHTLSHILIRRLGVECGYPIASLRERLYYEEKEGKISTCGLLIYTSSGDAEGTLGGLVRQGRHDRFPIFFENAVIGSRWCSADPLCIESKGQGREALNLAACHACVLLPEISCENQNVYLDRGLLVETKDNLGFFSDAFKTEK